MSIRSKLSMAMGALIAAVVTAVGAGLFLGERAPLLRKAEEARRGAMDQFARSAADAYTVRDDIALLNAAEIVAGSPGAREAFFVNPDGIIAAHSEVTRVGKRDPGDGEDLDILRLSRDVALGGGRSGRAVIIYSRSEMARDLSKAMAHTIRLIAAMSAAGLLLGLAGAWVLAYHLTRPIHRIIRGAQALAQGTLDHRLGLDRKDELGLLARNFDRMAERLGEVDRRKRYFVSIGTHELRSPLSAIESSANAMIEDCQAGDTADTMKFLTIVRNNAARLGRFINDLLDLSRIEAKRWDLAPTALAVDGVFSEVVALFIPKARERGLALVAEAAPGLFVTADPDKLHQVLFNLVGNSIKFTPAGGKITLGAERIDGQSAAARRAQSKGARPASAYIALSVKDTGCGIAAEDLERIFHRFEQVRRMSGGSEPKGTGLGLAICSGWAEAHGGSVLAESAPGSGSVFTVYFPEERRS